MKFSVDSVEKRKLFGGAELVSLQRKFEFWNSLCGFWLTQL